MTNHPNRSPRAAGRSPTGNEVAAARIAAGLSYAQCAAMVYESPRRWTDFESGTARMHPAAWELFQLKTSGRPAVILDHVGPRAGETWYDRDTGCAVTVEEVREGIAYARACGSSASITLGNWHDYFQRDPVAV